MVHNIELILTLTGGLTAALIFGFITQKLKLSPIVGYLLAGVLVGPHTPGFIADKNIADQSAEIGVILLMFGVGLHFHLKDLLAVKGVALPGAAAQIAVATGLGAVVAHFIGWSWTAGIIFGMAISVASTVVLTRVLADNRALHTPAGHVAIGWLIVEDLFTILVLVLLPAIFAAPGAGESSVPGGVWGALAWTLVKLSLMAGFILYAGQKIIPRFLGWVARTGSRELFTLTVLVLALGIAVGSAKLFGASMALGAFLGGMVVGQSEYSERAASEALPMRDAFAVLFFVSVGMMLDPGALLSDWPLILMTLGIILLGKPLAAMVVVLALRRPLRTALSVAVALGQIGEFSFILATLATSMKLLPESAMNALVAGSVISITLNPLWYKAVEPMARWFERRRPADAAKREEPEIIPEEEKAGRVVVVGSGPVGRTLCRILRDNGLHVTVLEMNIDTVKELHAQGIDAVYGDASRPSVLQHAGIERAESLIISASGVPAREVVRAARELNPHIRILTRASYLKEGDALRGAGANAVFTSEGELALSMATFIMERLGATDEQVERERDRVRDEFFHTQAIPA